MKRLDQELATISGTLQEQAKTLVRLTVTVEEHVKRSNAHEEEMKTIRQEIEPIKAHVSQMDGAGKLLGLVALVATIGTFIFEIIRKLF